MTTCTIISPVNIALVKYWGKRDEKLILPFNSSLSVTLDTKLVKTVTKIEIDKSLSDDIFYLNDEEVDINSQPRVKRILEYARSKGIEGFFKINSENSFPTASGMASSASGFCALAAGVKSLLNLSEVETATLARLGSGSACRSLYGGFVEWPRGSNDDGSDSIPIQVFDHNHWPEIRIILAQSPTKKKAVSSTEGMKRTAASSELYKLKVESNLSELRVESLKNAISCHDFDTFAEIVMKESNTLHAVCMDAYPPIEPPYLTEFSHSFIHNITALNKQMGKNICAYTFDAGSHCFIFTLESYLDDVFRTIFSNYFVAHVDEDLCDYTHKYSQLIKEPVDENKFIEGLYILKVGSGVSTQ